MKKILFVLIIAFFITYPSFTYASEEVIQEQQEELNISSFIKEAKKYTSDVFSKIDIGDVLNSAIKGNVDNSFIYKAILALIGKEVITGITTLRKYFDYYSCT